MIERTCQYETEDGEVFEHYSSAVSHETEQELKDTIMRFKLIMSGDTEEIMANRIEIFLDIFSRAQTKINKGYKE